MKYLGLVFVVSALVLTGCANAPQIPLSAQQVQGLKITGIEVTYATEGMIAWSDEELRFAKANGYVDSGSAEEAAKSKQQPSYDALVNSPESKQHQKSLLLPRVKAAFDNALSDKTTGVQPVKVSVVIKEMSSSSDAQCAVIGGARWILGTASLIDAAGKTLASYDNLHGGAMCAGVVNAGVLAAVISATQKDPIDVMTGNMATNFKTWLTPKVGPG
jgi:hypothetical protein